MEQEDPWGMPGPSSARSICRIPRTPFRAIQRSGYSEGWRVEWIRGRRLGHNTEALFPSFGQQHQQKKVVGMLSEYQPKGQHCSQIDRASLILSQP